MNKSLLWKEFYIVWPFVAALAVMAMMLFGASSFLTEAKTAQGLIFILIPNLVALGLPLLQVSQEEENGTLRWQRGLPISWHSAAFNKCLVGHVGWIFGWCFTVGCDQIGRALRAVDFRHSELLLYSPVSYPEIEYARYLTFSWLLLGIGYACAWTTKTAAKSLMLLVLATIAFTIVSEECVNWTLSKFFEGHLYGTPQLSLGFVFFNAATAMFAFVIAALMMRRRWLGGRWSWFGLEIHRASDRTPPMSSSTEVSAAYQPPAFLWIHSPSQFRALLWHAFRQASGGLLIAGLLSLTSLISYVFFDQRNVAPWVMLQGILAVIVIGVNTFGADGYKLPQKFYSEHGVSGFAVWSTRLLVTLGAFTCILAVHWFEIVVFADFIQGEESIAAVYALLIALVVSLVIGMFARHAIVSYLLCAAVALLVFIYSGFLYSCYPIALWTGAAALASMTLLTLPLCRIWLQGERGRRLILAATGFAVASIAVSIVPILLYREWQSPASDPKWRSQMMVDAQREAQTQPMQKQFVYLNGFRLTQSSNILRFTEQESALLKSAFEPSAAESIAYYLYSPSSWFAQLSSIVEANSADEVYKEMGFGSQREFYRNLIELGIGSIERTSLANMSLAESDDLDLLEIMLASKLKQAETISILGSEECEKFISRLRTPEQKRTQRRKALLKTWLDTSEENGGLDIFYSRTFPSESAVRMRLILPWEITFLHRRLDGAVRLSLQQLESGHELEPQQNALRREAWDKMETASTPGGHWPTQYW